MRLLLATLAAARLLAGSAVLFPADLTCPPAGKIRFIYNGETRTAAEAFCFSADHSYFLDPRCRDGSCGALAPDFGLARKEHLTGDVGSPGFKLCRRLGGEAQLLEYFDGEKWWPADRCVFAKDGSFVDTGILMKNWALHRPK